MSDIPDYIKCIIQKYESATNNTSKRIYINKKENIITFKIKTRYYLELIATETMNLLDNT